MTFRIWNVGSEWEESEGPWLAKKGYVWDSVVRIDFSPPCCRAFVEEQHRMQGLGYFWGWDVVY